MSALDALDPRANAVVHAAAGTGKTWLLTSRIIRLLLEGSAPGSILAITFTRKAATDIHERLRRRLFEFAAAPDDRLDELLRALGAAADSTNRARARELYEAFLTAVVELRATTFHAFCQDLLRRFPLEANLPGTFALLERTTELEATAWDAFDRELARDATGPMAHAMDILLRACGPTGAHGALDDFLAHRNDWWAYTEDEADPAGFAVEALWRFLNVSCATDPRHDLLADVEFRTDVARCGELLARHPLKGTTARAADIATAYAPDTAASIAYDRLRRAFYTDTGTPRAATRTKTLERSLGTAGIDELMELHPRIVARLDATHDQALRFDTLATSQAWYACGRRLLDHYQKLKRDRGLLDFADLEWHAYRLLNRAEQAHWVQYKLDQRIDHLLIDEFQDTNPTQWRLLLPLLQEMAAGDTARARSAFLVGDEKQSIYRFRRAEPKLFHVARDWLTHHARAKTHTQHISWRSSPAVIEFVNLVFDEGAVGDVAMEGTELPLPAESETPAGFELPGFRTHATHHAQLWGMASLLPLVPRTPTVPNGSETLRDTLRNPLEQPRIMVEDDRHHREGALIARTIEALIARKNRAGEEPRPLGYGDIMILFRDRVHAEAYESALRAAGIPYMGIGRGNFLDCLEVQDLVHLLTLLIAPYDDLACASVLRAPIFAVSDDDLTRLAGMDVTLPWIERLNRLSESEAPALARAGRLLQRWTLLADRIPIHDLLDRIYDEGDVVARYDAATPKHLRARVRANLERLLALALEVDSGRYPSLARLLAQLDALTRDETTAPVASGIDGVRLLTIHGAKGLEAPVVFLANAATKGSGRDRGSRALIEWPADRDRPQLFYLIGNKNTLDAPSKDALRRQAAAQQREEANMLYVALTRAQQVLYVSGCEPANADRGWYGFIERRLEAADVNGAAARSGAGITRIPHPDRDGVFNIVGHIEHGVPEQAPLPTPVKTDDTIDPALTQPFPTTPATMAVSPSRLATDSMGRSPTSTPAAARGQAVHRMLELLSALPATTTRAAAFERLRREYATFDDEWCAEAWREACAVVDEPALQDYYDPTRFLEARNELPILYESNGAPVYGVIDRLIRKAGEIVLLDYKTHAVDAIDATALAAAYAPQMRAYATGVRALWPGHTVRARLVFTASRRVIPIETDL